MPLVHQALDDFLSAFEQNAADGDYAAVATQFADTFLAGSPAGAIAVSAATFAETLGRRKEVLSRAGLSSSRLAARNDTPIGESYVLVDTKWEMDFAPRGQPKFALTVRSSFLIHLGGGQPKILAYLSHQDIFAMLKERDVQSRA